MQTRRRSVVPLTLIAAFRLAAFGVAAGVPRLEAQAPATGLAPADVVIRAAVAARLGVPATIDVASIDAPSRPGLPTMFRAARPDPSARLGRPMRFALQPATGMPVTVIAVVHVVAEHVVAARAIDRNETMTPDAMRVVSEELRDVPLRKVLTPSQVRGGRVLRPMAAGATVMPGAVIVRRAIEPGDKVTVVAVSGDVQVSAELIAADGGDAGDVIRVVNPDTRKDLRGRIVKEGLVEVNYAR
jgi:flagella basal body P-ring formation protein FlgA